MLTRIRLPRVWLRFLVSFIAVLSIPTVAGVLLVRHWYTLMRFEVGKRVTETLGVARDVFDADLGELQIVTNQMLWSDPIQAFLSLDSRSGEPVGVLRTLFAQYELDLVYYEDRLASDIWIYNPEIDVLVTTTTSIPRVSAVYGSAAPVSDRVLYDAMSFDEWRAFLAAEYRSGVLFPAADAAAAGRSFRAMPYVRSFGASVSAISSAAVIFFIDQSAVGRAVRPQVEQLGGWFVLATRDGTIYTSFGSVPGRLPDFGHPTYASDGFSQIALDDRSSLVSYAPSQRNDLILVAGFDTVKLFSSIARRRDSAIFVGLLTVALMVAVAMILSARQTAPVYRVVDLVRHQLGTGEAFEVDGLESVRTTLERLFEQHDEVAASLSASRTVVEQTIVRMILAGELHSEEEISGTLSYAGIELRAPWITSIILERVPSGLRSAKDVALASRQLSSQAVQVRLVAPGYRGSLTGLALVDSSDQQTASDLLVQRLRRADELGAAKVAVGGFKPSLVEAHRSLMEAEQALSRLHSSPGLVVWYTQVPRRSGQYYLPFELEGRLITAARHGSLQLVDQVLGEIRTENFESAAVVPAQCEILLATLEGIVQRVESEAELVTALPTADEDDGSPIRRFDNLTERFRAVCAALGASHGPTAAAMEEARRIVESEYGNTQIGLGYVADRLHLSEAYLSRAFKKVVGENFYSYLTRVRMRVAQDLLEAGTVSISDVWKKVGYTSGRGFARAFRSYSGRSPAEYRGSVGNADRN